MLAALSFQELREVLALTNLEMPWIAVELVIHAFHVRRMMEFEVPDDLHCIEFFAGNEAPSQVAKGFTELGLGALAFDIQRSLRSFILSGSLNCILRSPHGVHYFCMI